MINSKKFKIGERVRVEEEAAEIKYIGKVDGYGEQIWIGLEWDNPKRGKHDGLVKGKRYFQTRNSTGGSLMKIENVQKAKNLLIEIKNRYIHESLKEEQIELNGGNKKIELIGMEKTGNQQSKIEKLINIVLDNRSVGCEPPDDCPKFELCRELNLYGNLLYQWVTIKRMMRFFPRIQELNLRRNRMMKFENDEILKKEEEEEEEEENLNENVNKTFSDTCQKLVLSECGLDNSTINSVLKRFPAVTELVAFENGLNKLDLSKSVAQQLSFLDLEDNPIGSIERITGNYPNLVHLSVANCKISILTEIKNEKFPKLENLNLRGNSICDWKSINNLQSLKLLKKLLIDCKNLSVEKGINVFEVIIAKLSNLEDLNRFDVSEVERRSAEIRYLNKYFGLEKNDDHIDDMKRLVNIHGEPSIDTAKKGMKVIKIRIECGNRVEMRSFPLRMTVQKIKGMLVRLFKLNQSANIRLYLVMTNNNKQHRIELENPLREFGHYSPSEDRDVLVVEID